MKICTAIRVTPDKCTTVARTVGPVRFQIHIYYKTTAAYKIHGTFLKRLSKRAAMASRI